jgi:hypothetical protein
MFVLYCYLKIILLLKVLGLLIINVKFMLFL